jgi:hypothetical protein
MPTELKVAFEMSSNLPWNNLFTEWVSFLMPKVVLCKQPEVEFLIEVRTISVKCVRQDIHMEGEREDLL